MVSKRLPPATLLVPTPVVLVSCLDEAEKPNIITLAWAGVVNSEPPMIGISIRPNRHSHAGVKKWGAFVVNLPSEEIVRKVDACGVLSGARVNKFEVMEWTPVPGEVVKAPRISECSVQLECVVKQTVSLGSHDLFLGEIVALHVKEDVLKGRDEIDIAKFLPIAFCPGAREYWSLGKRMGGYGFSKGKP